MSRRLTFEGEGNDIYIEDKETHANYVADEFLAYMVIPMMVRLGYSKEEIMEACTFKPGLEESIEEALLEEQKQI